MSAADELLIRGFPETRPRTVAFRNTILFEIDDAREAQNLRGCVNEPLCLNDDCVYCTSTLYFLHFRHK